MLLFLLTDLDLELEISIIDIITKYVRNLYNYKHDMLEKKDFISCLDIVILCPHSVNYVEIPFKVQKM